MSTVDKPKIGPARTAEYRDKMPWEGQLRPGETPLHWAVRHHDHSLALDLRSETRSAKLAQLSLLITQSLKDKKIVQLLKTSKTITPEKLRDAIEAMHATEHLNLDKKRVQKMFDPDLLKIVEHPDFSKMLSSPKVLELLWGMDIAEEQDAKGISPLDEAVLQEDREMVQLLLHPQIAKRPALDQFFKHKIQTFRSQLATLRNVDLAILTPAGRAAHQGDLEAIKKANNIDQADPSGLKPLHYAILGGHTEVIQYLLSCSNLFSLTPQGRSYLDFAIASGKGEIFEIFSSLGLPFTLGKPNQKLGYLIASGIVEQQLTQDAKIKDPLARAGRDQTVAGINLNALWLGSILVNWAFKQTNPPPLLSKFAGLVMVTSCAWNFIVSGPPQMVRALPFKWAQDVFQTSLGLFASYQTLAHRVAPLVGPIQDWVTYLNGVAAASPVATAAIGVIGTSCLALRLWGAMKPVLERLPAYRDTFRSRPRQVVVGFCTDLMNVATQVAMTYFTFFPPFRTPEPTPTTT